MADKKERVFKVVNVQNGGTYLIGEEKLNKEVGMWTMFIEPIAEVEEPKEKTANEIKLELKEKGIEFKGNAKREDLEKLLTEG